MAIDAERRPGCLPRHGGRASSARCRADVPRPRILRKRRRGASVSQARRRVGSACDAVRPPARARRAPGHRPQARPGEGRAPGPRDRHDRGVPPGPLRAVPRHRPARARRARGVRRLGRRDPRAHDRHRRGRQVLERRRAHAAAHPPADRARADRRQRGAEAAATCAAIADRRAARRLRALRAAGRQRRDGHAHQGRPRRRRLGAHRHQVLDVGRRAGRLVLRLRQDRPGRLARARRHLVLRRRAGAGPASRSAAPTTRWACGRRHRRAAPRRRAGAGRERRR